MLGRTSPRHLEDKEPSIADTQNESDDASIEDPKHRQKIDYPSEKLSAITRKKNKL